MAHEREALLRALAANHFEFIWRILRRTGLSPEDAEDAAQEVFMTALQKLDRIDHGRERTFLYGVALRVSANARRKLARRRERPFEPLLAPTDESMPQHRELELVQARERLDSMLAELPDELRRVLILAEIEDLAMVEIAALENVPPGTVASRLRRARAHFAEVLRRRGLGDDT